MPARPDAWNSAIRAATALQPRPAIHIGEWDPGAHPRHVLGGVQVSASTNGQPVRVGQQCADGRLATPGHAHHQDGGPRGARLDHGAARSRLDPNQGCETG